MEQIRSFIAIELPAELKTRLAQLQDDLKSDKQAPVKWVDPQGIHLTLKFLGNVPENKIDDITRAMEEAARGVPRFGLEVKEPGAFPDLRRVQVVWIGISGQLETLYQLQQRIEANLAPVGFAPESRKFTPHLTLARLRDRASSDEQQRFGQLIANTKFEPAFTFEVDTIDLMRSQLTREGAIYSRLSSASLK